MAKYFSQLIDDFNVSLEVSHQISESLYKRIQGHWLFWCYKWTQKMDEESTRCIFPFWELETGPI